jgi:sec-independent protein translocase protein TatC
MPKTDSLAINEDITEAFERYFPFILEIRKRVFFVLAIFLIFAILGFLFYENIITVILKLFAFDGVNVVFTSPFQFLTLAVNTGILMGSIVVFPLIIFQILAFLKPALDRHEYKTILFLVPLSIILFISGFAFGVLMMRYVILLFYEKTVTLDIGNFLDISSLMSQILITSALMGIGFQYPIFMTLLMKFRVIKLKFFQEKRVFAYAISLVFAALLPPTDLLSLVLLTLPLIALYEITIFVNKFFIKPAKI